MISGFQALHQSRTAMTGLEPTTEDLRADSLASVSPTPLYRDRKRGNKASEFPERDNQSEDNLVIWDTRYQQGKMVTALQVFSMSSQYQSTRNNSAWPI
ncbi:hypothetical protein PoB_002544400 [Plakobranchus ocellatus]|uniref:Uncharacterized protein n=1 Tax=Plakobranchus ocellatus TaxID=259542 RepID=A0AAV3ZUC0_9GAST|nr:hypothetical protein PoB_002544400 [Plakobranchus ocellatus]